MTFSIQPVDRHTPGYPRFAEVEDWQGLLQCSSRKVFCPRTLWFAGLLGTALLLPTAVHAAPLHSQNPKALQIAEAELTQAMTGGYWAKAATLDKQLLIPGNPQVTVPKIPISFGNSYTGLIDANRTKKVTRELFAAFGVDLLPDHPLSHKGISFTADGWDPNKRVGFELLETPTDTTDVTTQEFERMKREIAADQMTIFVVPHSTFPVMDNDAEPATQAYLQSVLDYLDWLKAQGRL